MVSSQMTFVVVVNCHGNIAFKAIIRRLPTAAARVMWDLWWTKWHSEYFGLPCQSFHTLLHPGLVQ
jgi:hypothetical protein